MSKSVKRVARAAEALGLDIEIVRMGQSTRTAEDAAAACDCSVGQIVKSLIFKGRETGDLVLFLVSGANRVDPDKAEAAVGQALDRVDANDVRARTGFAIGGVAPIGHLETPGIWIDTDLAKFDLIWAAAGAPDAVFSTTPDDLARVTAAKWADLAGDHGGTAA